MTIITLLTYLVMAVALGVGIAVVIKIIKRVKTKAIASGVVFSDGLQRDELRIVTKLLKEELEENAELEAIKTLKRIIDKAATARKIV